jgi:hypothetical protein
LAERLRQGKLVPYLGPGALSEVIDPKTSEPIPADSDSLILAMNQGRPMAQRLMWEFPRAAMDVELKRGRGAVTRFLDTTYGSRLWTRAPLHDWLAAQRPHYVVDINRDTQLQDSYAQTPHTLVRGISRIGGTDFRFRIHAYDGATYREVDQGEVDPALPTLFKPMGSPRPDATYIASDADYVDYISELMGGFAIPDFLKDYRRDCQYLLLGLRLTRDTERMILSDIIYAAGSPAGFALIPNPTEKERRFCQVKGIKVIEADIPDLLGAADWIDPP